MSPSSKKLSTATNCKESPPSNKPYLPDHLLLSCFARVSRLYYPTLSLVSKRFFSLVDSLELYQTRTLLSRTESCLYVCLLDPYKYSKPYLFSLCKRPTLVVNPNPRSQGCSPFKILTSCTWKKERKPSENILVPLPSLNSPCSGGSYAIVGSNIYIIGGFIGELPSSRVFFMDCRTHTWHEAPSMRIARKYPQLSVLDGKIYVMEETKDYDSSDWMEVFDPITQIWEDVPGPDEEIRGTVIAISFVFKGNLYCVGDKEVVYKPKENKWEAVGLDMSDDEIWKMVLGALLDSICEIDNIRYLYRSRKTIEWCDYETRSWKVVKGLKKLMTNLSRGSVQVQLVNFGGKIAVLRQETSCPGSIEKIWCGVIALERRKKHEIYGKVEWFDLFTVPTSFCLKELLVATL